MQDFNGFLDFPNNKLLCRVFYPGTRLSTQKIKLTTSSWHVLNENDVFVDNGLEILCIHSNIIILIEKSANEFKITDLSQIFWLINFLMFALNFRDLEITQYFLLQFIFLKLVCIYIAKYYLCNHCNTSWSLKIWKLFLKPVISEFLEC